MQATPRPRTNIFGTRSRQNMCFCGFAAVVQAFQSWRSYQPNVNTFHFRQKCTQKYKRNPRAYANGNRIRELRTQSTWFPCSCDEKGWCRMWLLHHGQPLFIHRILESAFAKHPTASQICLRLGNPAPSPSREMMPLSHYQNTT